MQYKIAFDGISLNRKQSGKKFQKIVKFYIEILNS